jgi:hypothetical protein
MVMQDGIESARALVFWHVSFREPAQGRKALCLANCCFALLSLNFSFQFAFQTIPFLRGVI